MMARRLIKKKSVVRTEIFIFRKVLGCCILPDYSKLFFAAFAESRITKKM
jgi:hypothetical protein